MRGLSWIQRALAPLFARRHAIEAASVPSVLPKAAAPRPAASAAAKAGPRRGRPVSDSLSRTVELLRGSPEMTAAELAASLPVSRDYARTLLRRARAKMVEERPPAVAAAKRKSKRNGVSETAQATPPTDAGSHRAEVLARVGRGESARDIASSLGMPVGEVDFILKIDGMLQRSA